MRPRPPPAGDPALLDARLGSQLLGRHELRTPSAVVAWMGAMQAQDFGASRWAVGVRLPGATEATIERALSEGSILRTHLLRGTWQLVARDDLRWMLALVAPRLLQGSRSSRERELGLDTATFRRSRTVLTRTLADGEHRTRVELAAALERAGLPAAGPRLAHLLQRAELEGLVCSGVLRRHTPTYALLDQRIPAARPLPPRDGALRELAIRHVRGRGPCTAVDLAAWAGLTLADARAGLEAARPALLPETIAGEVHWRRAQAEAPARATLLHLLPAFDEYVVGYRDRSAMIADERAARLVTRNGIFSPCVVAGGRVIGLWRRAAARRTEVELQPFEGEPAPSPDAFAAAARRYGAFLGLPVRAGEPRRGRLVSGPPARSAG